MPAPLTAPLLLLLLPLLLLLQVPCPAAAATRTYFLSVDPSDWDYYPPPRRLNRCTGRPFTPQQALYTASTRRNKLRFTQHANLSFSAAIPRPTRDLHLGLLGPLLRAEGGDQLRVYLRAPPSLVFSVAGLPAVQPRTVPGHRAVRLYRFPIAPRTAPRSTAFVNSTLLLYTATRGRAPDANAGAYAGLVGGVILYPRGALSPRTARPPWRELLTVLWISDEATGKETGPDQVEGNLKHVINGRIFCSVPELRLFHGEPTRWYFASFGNEVDVHAAHTHGIVGLSEGGAHTDAVRLLPGATAALDIIPDNSGVWLLHCHINDHLRAGMTALFTVRERHENCERRIAMPARHSVPDTAPSATPSAAPSPTPSDARERVYYVQAEDVEWDYAPLGRNKCDRAAFGPDELIFVEPRLPITLPDGAVGGAIGARYLKTRYLQYTNASFSAPLERDRTTAHHGLMGPVLRARVGDVIVVHFRNAARDPVSLHPHGVFYTKAHEGAPYNDGTSGADKLDDSIEKGGSYTYRWQVPPRAGPGPGERQDTKLWMYHSHRDEIADTYAGLFGPIVIVAAGADYDDDTLMPNDGTSEAFLHMSVMNEGQSFHLEENALAVPGNSNLTNKQFQALLESDDFQESNLMHSINGYLYCNGPPIRLEEGKPTRFYFYALGSEVDLHTPMVGKEVLQLDVKSSRGSGYLLAGTFSSALVTPLHTGRQELRCNVNDHVIAGMRALYFVKKSPPRLTIPEFVNVTHYIAAEEVAWNYAPLGKDGCTKEEFGEDEKVFTEAGAQTPGSRYMKAVYREYEDGKFTKRKSKDKPSFSGVVGPLLHFAVDEIVRIVFRNKLSFGANMNIVGLELLSSTSNSSEIAPGAEVTYFFRVPTTAGPSQNDLDSVAYVYYSSVDPIAHVAAGLTGVIAVAKNGRLDQASRLPVGTTAAYPLLLNIFRENESPLLQKSLSSFALEGDAIDEEALQALQEDEEWLESNAMHSINGYLYGNNPKLREQRGTVVRFYVFGFGSEASMHVPLFAGQVVDRRVRMGNAAEGVQILPFNAETADVRLVTKGLWTISCAVADHVLGGMKVCVKVW